MNNRTNAKLGYTIVELLVVIALFAIIASLVTRSLALVLQGSRKSQAVIGVRQNLDYALTIITRQLYNAERITAATTNRITYEDQWGVAGKYFECYDASSSSTSGRVASSSATTFITSLRDVYITSCNFTCNTAGLPHNCSLSITGNSTASANPVTVTSGVVLRNY